MKRLTKRVDGIAVLESWAIDKDPVSIIQRLCNRLAAYEDSGLEPEEIADFMNRWERTVEIAGICRKGGIDHLLELKKAEQDGRLVVLPCKVGDTVYVIGESCDFCETYLDEPERCMRCDKGHYAEERGFELWMLSELNESIFLTREEAEAALAQKGGKCHA